MNWSLLFAFGLGGTVGLMIGIAMTLWFINYSFGRVFPPRPGVTKDDGTERIKKPLWLSAILISWKCPLLALSGHGLPRCTCPLLTQSRHGLTTPRNWARRAILSDYSVVPWRLKSLG